MSFTVVKSIAGHRYAYEYESYYDPKARRSRQRMIRYLGACDTYGTVRAPPKVSPEAVHSAFPVGPLATFYAAAMQLRVRETIQEVLGTDERGAAPLLIP